MGQAVLDNNIFYPINLGRYEEKCNKNTRGEVNKKKCNVKLPSASETYSVASSRRNNVTKVRGWRCGKNKQGMAFQRKTVARSNSMIVYLTPPPVR